MASLLSWLGNAARDVFDANTVADQKRRLAAGQPRYYQQQKPNAPSNLLGQVVQHGQAAVAQGNPLDGGRTYNTVRQQGADFAPNPVASVLNQVTHNGITNFAGDLVKPLAQFPLDAGTLAYNKVVAPVFNLPQQNIQTNPVLGGAARYVDATGTPRQTLGSGLQTAITLGTGGVGGAIDKSFTAVAPKVVPKIATKVVSGAGTGAVVGAPFNVAATIGNDNIPLTKDNLKNAAIQGAQFGAVLGGGAPVVGAVAPVATKAVIKGAKATPEAVKSAKYTYDKLDPRVRELDAQYNQLNQQWQSASPASRKQIAMAIKANRQARAETTQLALGNSIKRVNGSNDNAGVNGTGRNLPSKRKPEQLPTVQPGKIETPTPTPGDVSLSTNYTPVTSVVPVTGKVRQSGSKLLTSKNITPEVKQNLTKDYTSHSFTQQRDLIAQNVAKNLSKATDTAQRLVSKDSGSMSDADHQFVSTVAAALDAKGTKASQQLAESLYNGILRHRTATGQTFAAFREMSNNPNILKAQALNFLKNKNIELSKEEKGQLDGLIKELRKTQLGTPARDEALHNVIQYVTNKVPTKLGDKIVNFWRAGLLTSPITTGGNILGNTGEAVVRNTFVNPIATAADVAQSLITGKRTKTLAGGQIKGGVSGVQDAKRYLKTGFDPNNPMTKFEGRGDINYGNSKVGKATTAYVNAVYRGLGAQDKPFRQAAANQAKIDLAKADAINLKLKGQARQDYIDKAVADQNWQPKTFQTMNDSKAAGEFAVFANETVLGKAAQLMKQPITIKGRTYNGAVRQFIMPFTQVPASIAMRILHRSDLGATEIANQILRVRKGLPYDQRAVSEAIGNGTFGPAAIAAGYALSKAGQITGNYPTDPKERALWQAEGKQANSVRIGNRWYSLNYMQPFGTLLGIGDQINHDEKNGKSPTEIISAATGRAAKSVESQSFLQGIDGLLSAVNDPERSAKQYINSTASSVVPNFIRTTARATDPLQRDVQNAPDALKSTIPGLREKLPAKQDMFGRNVKATDNPANQLFNPLRPSLVRNSTDKTVQELRRLQDGGNGIVTTHFDKNSITGAKLNDQQVRDLNKMVNSRVRTAWDAVIADPRYKSLSDEDKATALKHAKDQIASAYKRQFAADNNMTAALEKPATKGDIAVLSGQKQDYISKLSIGSASTDTPAQKYQTALKNYQTNSKNMTDVQKFAAEQNLKSLKVQAPFPSDVIKLYGMSKADAYQFLTTNKNGKKLADQLIAYDKARYNAGLSKYMKYDNGIAPATKKGRSGKGRGGSRSRGAPKANLSTILTTLKSTNTTTSPIKAPSKPNITVKTNKLPAKYRQTALKQYKVTGPRVPKIA